MIIAIDDSGDPGLKIGKGSSRFFVIASIMFEDDLDAEETALKIKRLRQSLRWKPQHEFKFRKTSPEIRKQFLKEIASCNFKISIVALNKTELEHSNEFKKDASKLYNAVILKSLKGFSGSLKQAHILIDGESGSSYRRNVKTFFRKNLPRDAMRQLTYRDSTSDNLIQLADMIAGSVHRSVDKDKDSGYFRLIRKHIVSIELSL